MSDLLERELEAAEKEAVRLEKEIERLQAVVDAARKLAAALTAWAGGGRGGSARSVTPTWGSRQGTAGWPGGRTVTEIIPGESWLGIGAEILFMAKRIRWERMERKPHQPPVIFQKFSDTRMISMRMLEGMRDTSWRDERIAAAFGKLHTHQTLNLIRFLEHGTGEEHREPTGDFSTLKGWRAWVPEGTPFDVERCRLYCVYLFESRAHFRWDWEAVTLKLESLVGLEVTL